MKISRKFVKIYRKINENPEIKSMKIYRKLMKMHRKINENLQKTTENAQKLMNIYKKQRKSIDIYKKTIGNLRQSEEIQ